MAPEQTVPSPAATPPRWLLPGALLWLVAANTLLMTVGSWSPLIGVVTAVVAVVAARAAGHDRHSLGLLGHRRALLLALAAGGTALAAWAVAFAVTAAIGSRVLETDPRVASASPSAAVWSLLVVIPVGTVLAEEIAFRGVLLAELTRLAHRTARPARWGAIGASLLFGLWHIGPALAQAAATGLSAALTVGWVAGTVLFTAAAGLLFSWLRLRSGSVLAPAALHAAVNGGGFAAVWLAAHFIR